MNRRLATWRLHLSGPARAREWMESGIILQRSPSYIGVKCQNPGTPLLLWALHVSGTFDPSVMMWKG